MSSSPLGWLLTLKHQRSPEKTIMRKGRQEQKELARSIVLNFSLYCKDNGDRVFEAEMEPTVREKLEFAFGFIPTWAINKEYGEVLNRYSVRLHPMTVRWTKK
jgi:hypothetical protein